METNQTESVTQPVESGASTEVKAETLSKADMDFKRDMLRYKDEAATLKEKLKEIQLQDEQKKGNLEGVIQALKDEIKSLKHDNVSSKYNFASTQLDNAIKQEVLTRGVKDEKVLEAFMKLVDKTDKDIVELDDKFNVNREDIKSLVDKNMERYGVIFKSPINIVDKTPNREVITQPKKGFNIEKASAQETLDFLLKNKDKLK